MSIQLRDGLSNQSVDLVLEDLLVRFLVNVPHEDLSSIERIFFQVEEAQWFYTDFVRQLNPTLPGMKMKQFSTRLLEKCPLIWKWGDPSDAISRFGKYKSTIPVRGIALFNKDLTKMILVKGSESNTWSFPRGKISKDESDKECAVREVLEETGFDASDIINENDVVERTIKGKNYKIYLAKNVPEDFNFLPLARNEIDQIEWHDIKQIQKKIRTNPQKYFIVATVLKPLLRWINKNKGVLNEEELMLKAEIKLKAILGVNQPKQNNVDAGRELLDILQGVAPTNGSKSTLFQTDVGPSNQNAEQFVNMTLPQHLHNQLPFFNNTAINLTQAYPIGNQPFFFPPGPPIAPAPRLDQNLPSQLPPMGHQPQIPQQKTQAPSSNRRSSEANSKELLSILNRKPENNSSAHKHTSSSSNSHITESNRSKADQLLGLFKKSTQKASEDFNKHNADDQITSASDLRQSHVNIKHEPSNELEKSLESSHDFNEPGKKLRILKRPEKSLNGNASSELLSLLGKPPASSEPSSKSSSEEPKIFQDNGNNILKNNESSTIETDQRPTPVSKKSAANDLLNLLNQEGKTKDNVSNIKEQEKDLEDGSNYEDFENFEDFEDFDDLDNFGDDIKKPVHHFDIASDDEEEFHVNSKPSIEKIKASHRPFDTSAPAPAPAPEPPLAEKSPAPEETKRPIRILKPGESLENLFGPPDTSPAMSPSSPLKHDSNKKGNESKSLLELLHGGKPNNANEPATVHPEKAPSNDEGKSLLLILNGGKPPASSDPVHAQPDYSSIYGSQEPNTSQAETNSSNFSPFGQAPSSSSNLNPLQSPKSNRNSNSLLDLLGRRPPQETQAPINTWEQPQSSKLQSSGLQTKPLTLEDLESGNSVSVAGNQGSLGSDPPAGNQSPAKDLLSILKGGMSNNDSSSSFYSASSRV